jgi:thymidylate synthase ThyX
VIVPKLVSHAGGETEAVFHAAVERAWDGAGQVLRADGDRERALYLLPNALAIRFVESADLLNLQHKHKLRLCYNAQEEIWQASLDEARQITEFEPAIGRWLLPPCGVRHAAGRKPFCSEGEHYCGVPVWRLSRDDYSRVI